MVVTAGYFGVQVVAACIAVTSKISIAPAKCDSVPPEDSGGLVFLHCQVCLPCTFTELCTHLGGEIWKIVIGSPPVFLKSRNFIGCRLMSMCSI